MTDTVNGGVGLVKLAVTFLAVLMVTLQVPVPEQSPLQPIKVEPTSGAADKVTVSPAKYERPKHALDDPQVAPPEIAPLPVPALLNVRVALKFAVTNLALSMVTAQVVADPLQAPLQPLNVAPALGVAVNVTTVLGA